MSVIELVRDIWMNNACVKFEERSLNPSKVIALTTKRGGGRRRCGGCVADENIISPKTYVSREYNDICVDMSTTTTTTCFTIVSYIATVKYMMQNTS